MELAYELSRRKVGCSLHRDGTCVHHGTGAKNGRLAPAFIERLSVVIFVYNMAKRPVIFFDPHLLSSRILSLSLLVVTQDPTSYSRLFSPLLNGSCLAFHWREDFNTLYIPSSTRVELCLSTLSVRSAVDPSIILYVYSKSHRGGIRAP